MAMRKRSVKFIAKVCMQNCITDGALYQVLLQKITVTFNAPRAELYDRKSDAPETKNLFNEKTSIAKVLNSKLSDLVSKLSNANLPAPQKMDPETEENFVRWGT